VIRLVRIGGDEPVHVPDEVIDAPRKRERDGAIDLPTKRGRKNPRIGHPVADEADRALSRGRWCSAADTATPLPVSERETILPMSNSIRRFPPTLDR
jgi:hypothetical protein